jgi:hypothetical protein
MMLANTRRIWPKPAGSSRLVRSENLNDHAAEGACSQYRDVDLLRSHSVEEAEHRHSRKMNQDKAIDAKG